ncbi:flagellar hook-length control protein FliK [Thiobacillus denitrificans]|uniref:flagellar hook-length control protein FliK n=1 Tax=Thiobacillus denitrificans TaxID=36861 RepID=UPI0009E8E76F|nr:flagellar hook-length control protein FliK [Thiobacillus denitrificans]
MNATPMNINPVNAAQPQPAAGKQQDSAAPDVPFSQVLSSEMAQNRRNSETRQGADADAGKDAAAQAGRPTESGENAAAKATEAGESVRDPLAPPLAENAKTDPATLLGLAINPDQLKPAPAKMDSADANQPSDEDASILPFQNSRKGRTAQAGQFSGNAHDTQKIDPALSGKANLQASTTAAMATAFSGQLAAARQGDAMKGEFMSDLMSNPAMRPASQAAFETLHTLNEVASPKLAPTLGTTAWNQALGEKVVWMAAGAQQTATLTLNPPNMGPLQIVLNLANDQATANFFSAQPEVRQALEAAFPRLKEMMNEAGIQLEQATVSADTPRQDNPSDHQAQRVTPPIGADEAVTAGLQTIHAPIQQSGRGLIDTFA